MTTIERENMAELIAVLRTFPLEELSVPSGVGEPSKLGKMLGHYTGLAMMVMFQRHHVIKALENYRDDN